MSNAYPRSIPEFLSQLRAALNGADPAVIQDALYDAEEYLRGEVADNLDLSESELLLKMKDSYGTPEEVAAEYMQTEAVVSKATRTPEVRKSSSFIGKIFEVWRDPRTYAGMLFMLLSMATGIIYFTWAVTGLSMSVGFAILIFGIPFFLLFMASVRLFSLIEGRVIEVLLGERMPRRSVYPSGRDWMQKIKDMLTDWRTWSTLIYMVLMLPLGIFYFTFVVVGVVTSLSLMVAPFLQFFISDVHIDHIHLDVGDWEPLVWPETLILLPIGFLALTLVFHVIRFISGLHAKLGKHLLVHAQAA